MRPTIIRTQFYERDESRQKLADLRPSEIERAWAAAISMIATEDFCHC
jgi:hypothetical protein